MEVAVPFHLRVTGDSAAVVAAEQKLEAHLEGVGLSSKIIARAVLVLEEVVLNACRHGGAPDVEIEALADDRACTLVFEDKGAAFDPLSGQFEDTPPRREDDVGGRGLLLIRRSANRSTYLRLEDRNRLVLEFFG